MTTRSNSLVSDFCITNVLAEVGLNVLEQDNNLTADTEHDGCSENNRDYNLCDKVNSSDIKDDTKSLCIPETSKRADLLKRKSNTDNKKEPTNSNEHILKVSDDTDFGQPVQKKLRLSNEIPNEETNICDKSKLNYYSQQTPDIHCTISSKTAVFPRNQTVGLPSSLHGVNSDEVFIERNFGLRIR